MLTLCQPHEFSLRADVKAERDHVCHSQYCSQYLKGWRTCKFVGSKSYKQQRSVRVMYQ